MAKHWQMGYGRSASSEKSQEFMEVLGNSGLAESVFGNLARAARLGKGIDEDVPSLAVSIPCTARWDILMFSD